MPEALDDTAIVGAIDGVISATGAQNMRDLGKIVGLLKAKLHSRTNMGMVSGLIKTRLG